MDKNRKGKVYIIGAGPGDHKLLTLKAAECISRADVIVYDRLVGSKILGLAKKDAEMVYVGKLPEHHAVPQEGINRILVEKALEGKTVARVKGGDPFVFGRGGEEAEALAEAGIEFEVVPGVTSAVAVPAYAGIPVTHRDFCSSLHIITGHEKPGKEESSLDFETLSKLEGTLVFLMGVKNLSSITSNLIEYGKSKSTPAAVVEKGTTIMQRKVTGTLEDIAEKVKEAGIQSPAVTVIGEVAGLDRRLEWFGKGKLAGKRVLVTRSRQQASKLSEKIEELGGEALEFPVIRIEEPQDYSELDKALENIGVYSWVVFTSTNGVEYFFKRLRFKRIDIRKLSGTKLCAIGEATAEELEKMGLYAELMPQSYTTLDLLKQLLPKIKKGEKLLLARADIAGKELSEGLKEKAVEFDDIAVYRTVLEESGREAIIELLEKGNIDFVTFTSSSTVRNLLSILGKDNIRLLDKVKKVCIGPVTAKTAEESGLEADAVADVYTVEGLVNKLVELSEV
ncbi:MAG: uroporphyrinogen-III C-methyltransferase [Clostridia bacterium]|nr:uroporphyrinogen-III C-methyltransferase [Clostridia bacterium]